MSRARVAALALVNWKGVFFERYLLDRHVTALEGANGAGKTTVMIAAYVVLLPDMTRLRFTNVGESGASGGDRGIWGRLGEPGRPAYAALDLDLDGERVVLGVRLSRGAEPSVEATAFMATGLSEAVRLSELLLVRRDDGDHVPELDEVKTAVARSGGTIEVFRSAKDYFGALFERGISPLRLSVEEERGKWNDLLRTSMTGGISRALTSELRGFLLKTETGLSDTLSRMRANLEACRRTRVEVFEARQLEREISAVYEAGLAMFSMAMQAARAADREARARVAKASSELEDAERNARELAGREAQLAAGERELMERHGATRALVSQLTAASERQAAAGRVVEQLSLLEEQLARLQHEFEAAQLEQRRHEAARAAAKQERARALDAYDRASVGLAHLQEGLDELHRRAHAHRQLERSLAEARALCERPALQLGEVAEALQQLDAERTRRERERAAQERELRDVELRRAEYQRARDALQVLLEAEEVSSAMATREPAADSGEPTDQGAGPPAAESAAAGGEAARSGEHALARAVLARLAAREAAVADAARLERAQLEAQRHVARQTAALSLAASLHLPEGDASTVARTLDEVERALHAAQAAASAPAPPAELAELRERRAALSDRSARFRWLSDIASRLGEAPNTRADVSALRDRLLERQLALQTRQHALEAQRDQLQKALAELSRSGSNIDPELRRLADELNAELLADRFEDLEVGAAAWVQARLGPLVNALLVDDTDAAAAALAKQEHLQGSVHLVRAGSALALQPPEELGDLQTVVSEESWGVRVTRVEAQPSLGKRARERELADAQAALERSGEELERLHADAQHLAAMRRDADVLVEHLEVWLAGDPEHEQARIEGELERLEREHAERRERAQAAQSELGVLRPRLDGLRRLLPDAALLEPPLYADTVRELTARRLELAAARAELARLADARAQLAEWLDVLRSPPPDAAALTQLSAAREGLAQQLDRLFRARAALEDVVAHAYAASFTDAQAALQTQAALAPALEQQHASAREALQLADAAETEAGSGWETATSALQASEAQRAVQQAQRDRARVELEELGGASSSEALAEHARALAAAESELSELEVALRRQVAERALCEERRQHAERSLAARRELHAASVREAEPAAQRWSELQASCEQRGLLGWAGETPSERSSLQLTAESASKRELLIERVGRARGGDELVARLRDSALMEGWQAVREWLQRRVPAQIAEVDDPLLALLRLRDHLQLLEGRLQRQEGDLRGASEDVARGIDVQLRRAQSQVRRLNQQLEGIRFGSIHGIRIDMRRVERMEQILRALREGQAQELLFSSSLPIEEALEEIFKRYGGGGRSGGQRLLDYREYVELAVEIRRQSGPGWETASPTRLSTGEAIGVGAALMMVVLTEWERDANLLRARPKLGSVRFLFLDEANRLSRDNLGVLFDLCRTLDLQLLVAAPEVARAEGNTTYRLVRHVTEEGREEVIVSGRRAEAPTAVEEEPEELEQAAESLQT